MEYTVDCLSSVGSLVLDGVGWIKGPQGLVPSTPWLLCSWVTMLGLHLVKKFRQLGLASFVFPLTITSELAIFLYLGQKLAGPRSIFDCHGNHNFIVMSFHHSGYQVVSAAKTGCQGIHSLISMFPKAEKHLLREKLCILLPKPGTSVPFKLNMLDAFPFHFKYCSS